MKPGEALAAGHLLDGRYRISKVIGLGGMGRVYLANDNRLANRPVAVKEMIVGEGLQEKKAIEAFSREARVLAPLSHPGIPNLIDYFVENARHYLVMEFIDGGDLQSWLDKQAAKTRVPESKVLKWGRQILEVLSFLHSQNPPIVYRDLKPANIMIDKSGRAMLIDFGIARFLPPGGRGTQIGSVGYAPPEQYLGKMESRSDLYSLAATMHHLLSGRDPQLEPPFSFPSLRNLAPDVSIATETVVMQALERDIDRRPSSARSMINALPDPGRDSAGLLPAGHALISPRASAPSLAAMRTIVLPRESAQDPAPEPTLAASSLSHIPTGPTTAARHRPRSKVSSTAKTKDLRIKAGHRPGQLPAPIKSLAAGRQSSVGVGPQVSQQPSNGPARNGLDPVALNGPRLVAKSDSLEFSLPDQGGVIGRATGASDAIDIDLSSLRRGSDRISHRHAQIVKLGGDYFIRDLGSLNGTFIRGRGRLGRDQLYRLKDRDQVMFGSATLEFRKG